MISKSAVLSTLVAEVVGQERAARLFRLMYVHPALRRDNGPEVSRVVMAQALNMLLFEDLLERVPVARAYAEDCLREGRATFHDHGAIRTIDLDGMGALPAGREAILRILRPLGYREYGHYPLPRLRMTGRSYAQADLPEDVAQFFISELHVERFSTDLQTAVQRITRSSSNPLTPEAQAVLDRFDEAGTVPLSAAVTTLPVLAGCFGRQHAPPYLADYELLLTESAEAAWIATEGNAFNHATDRVDYVEAVAADQRALGRPMKDEIEVSASGRIRQTAFHAATVRRPFRLADGRLVEREVPGSFYEFITRARLSTAASEPGKLDLSFDSSNAQGIFQMTRPAQDRAA